MAYSRFSIGNCCGCPPPEPPEPPWLDCFYPCKAGSERCTFLIEFGGVASATCPVGCAGAVSCEDHFNNTAWLVCSLGYNAPLHNCFGACDPGGTFPGGGVPFAPFCSFARLGDIKLCCNGLNVPFVLLEMSDAFGGSFKVRVGRGNFSGSIYFALFELTGTGRLDCQDLDGLNIPRISTPNTGICDFTSATCSISTP